MVFQILEFVFKGRDDVRRDHAAYVSVEGGDLANGCGREESVFFAGDQCDRFHFWG